MGVVVGVLVGVNVGGTGVFVGVSVGGIAVLVGVGVDVLVGVSVASWPMEKDAEARLAW
jgi:hypothetical protein